MIILKSWVSFSYNLTFLFAQTASECLGVFFLEQLDIVVFVTPPKKVIKDLLTKDKRYRLQFRL